MSWDDGDASDPVTHTGPYLTPLIGREREVADLCARARREDVRLLVLTGPGGVGKSRLALQVADRARSAFDDGVVVVQLKAVSTPAETLPAVAKALDMRHDSGDRLADALAQTLQRRHLLLVLDNFEQVSTAAPQITDLLVRCPRLTALVTSRANLDVYGEHVFPVSPLSLPAEEPHALGGGQTAEQIAASGAVRLLVERIRARRPDFGLSDDNAPVVATICHRLDGFPLAIELAAARCDTFSLVELADRLEHRLAVLTAGPSDMPTRFGTMREAIAWSYELLEPRQQVLFRQLAIFVGGFTLDAADACTGSAELTSNEDDGLPAVLDDLISLVRQSLVERVDSTTDASRFFMRDIVREYALERMLESGAADDPASRHAEYFLALVERAEPELTGPEQAEWLERLDEDHSNLRAAFEWLRTHGPDDAALRFAKAVWRFGYTRGVLDEARQWLEVALAGNDAPPTNLHAAALNGVGILAATQGALDRAERAHREALDIAGRSDDRSLRAAALNGLGDVAALRELPDEAVARYEEARAEFELAGDRRGVAGTLTNQGNVLWDQGKLEPGRDLHERALRLYRSIGERRGIAWSLSNIGRLMIELGSAADAAAPLRDALTQYLALGDKAGIAEVFEGTAERAARLGDHRQAATLMGAARALREAIGAPVAANDRAHHDQVVDSIRTHLAAEFDELWERGQSLSLDEAIALVAEPIPGDPADRGSAPASPHRLHVPGGAPLTQRQMDVLRLLAEGKSDAEIADELFIGTRTVQTHLANVYARLGVSSRTAAAAHAIRHGLID